MEDAGRGRHDPNRAAGRGHGSCERFRAGRIRAGREPDQHLSIGHQDVAAIDEPVVDSGDGCEPGLEISGDRLRLAEPTRRARPKHDRVRAEAKRRIFDKHGVGERIEQRHFLDPDTRRFQCSPITDVLVDERSEVRVGAIVDSETIDHARGRRTNESQRKVDRTRHGQCSETIRRNFFVRS